MSVMAKRLCELRAADSSEQLRDTVLRSIEDPLNARWQPQELRINPILLLLASLAVMATGILLFFNLVWI